jgi:hypothetical protein
LGGRENSREMPEETRKKSLLVPIGILLIVVGLFMPKFIQDTIAAGQPRPYLALLVDLFRLACFVGIGCVLIGWLRNRRLKN